MEHKDTMWKKLILEGLLNCVTQWPHFIFFLPPGESLSPLGQVKDETPNKGRQAVREDGEGVRHGAEQTLTSTVQ